MIIYKVSFGIVVKKGDQYFLLENRDWDEFINQKNLYKTVNQRLTYLSPIPKCEEILLKGIQTPIGCQEVWAAGVTYNRSRNARMEEAQVSGGDIYDRVYNAKRPEIFFKSVPHRVRGPHQPLKIRRDSTWNVPEPELTLFINKDAEIAGCTVGNDLSSRSIEGDNPLYLPQAKIWDGCASLGPGIYVDHPLDMREATISLCIVRNNRTIFNGETNLKEMKRSFKELVHYLFLECSFPNGCFLMTGTGIIPPSDFTLWPGDIVEITIPPIGTLTNFIV